MKAEQYLLKSLGSSAKMYKNKVGDYMINYVKAGKGPNVLLLHGANVGWGQWVDNIHELAKHFTVYAIDLPGAGQSTPVDLHKKDLEYEYVDTVKKFIDQNLKKTHIIGHSVAAWICLRLALKSSKHIHKMVLVNPLGLTDFMPLAQRPLAIRTIAKFLSKTVMKPTRDNMKSFLTGVLHDKSKIKESFIDYVHESISNNPLAHPFLLINKFAGIRKVKKKFVLIDQIRHIKNPMLIIAGDKDPLIPIRDLSRSVGAHPRIQFEVFKNVGHVSPSEEITKFNKTVIAFLRP